MEMIVKTGLIVFQMAPHCQTTVVTSNWDRPYSQEVAAYPLVSGCNFTTIKFVLPFWCENLSIVCMYDLISYKISKDIPNMYKIIFPCPVFLDIDMDGSIYIIQ